MIDPHRFEKLRLWSDDPNGYAGLQPGLEYYDHEAGYIAYRRVLSGNVVLGDPVAAPGKLNQLLSDFLKTHPNSVFMYVSETIARALQSADTRSMNFIQIFYDRHLELPYTTPFSMPVQGALKKANKAGMRLAEKNLSEISPEELLQLKKINDFFINESRVKREMGLISRTMAFSKEPDVRLFTIHVNSEADPIGFVTLDPWYSNGQFAGYQLNQFRLGPTKLWGLYLSVVATLVQILHSEGIEKLSLGGCIDLKRDDSFSLPASKLWQVCRGPSIKMSDDFYGLSNLSKNKFEFTGTNSNRYIAAPHKIPFIPLLRVARAFRN